MYGRTHCIPWSHAHCHIFLPSNGSFGARQSFLDSVSINESFWSSQTGACRCTAGVDCKEIDVTSNKDKSLLLPELNVSSVTDWPYVWLAAQTYRNRAPGTLPQTCFPSVVSLIINGNSILLVVQAKNLRKSLFLTFYIWPVSKSCWLCLQNISRIRPLLLHCHHLALTTVNFHLDYWNNLLTHLPASALGPLKSILNPSSEWACENTAHITSFLSSKPSNGSQSHSEKKAKSLQGSIYPRVTRVLVADRL